MAHRFREQIIETAAVLRPYLAARVEMVSPFARAPRISITSASVTFALRPGFLWGRAMFAPR